MRLRIVALFALALSVVIPAMGQQDEVVTVKKSDLTAEQLKKVEAQNVTEQLGQYKEWSEIGKGVGYAVKESLGAVKDVAVDFSKTDIGKYTMFLVGWKIMAKDILDAGDLFIGYLVGIPLLTIGLAVIVWSYRRQCVARPVLIEKGAGFWIWRSKKYEIYDPAVSKGNMTESDWVTVHVSSVLVLIVVCCMIMFFNH